jgi:DNA-binding NarL/FixJ family response regulator
MKIILVEDDWDQEKAICDALRANFDGLEVETITTESGFIKSLDRIVRERPDLVIFDMMLRFADPSPSLDDTWLDLDEYLVQQAGLRCQKLLSDRVPEIRTLFYSILQKKEVGCEVPEGVCYLPKGESSDRLLKKVSHILKIPIRTNS